MREAEVMIMTEWFFSGGFGMFLVLAIGAGSIGYGIKAVREPAADRIAALRSLPALLLTSALFSFGTGLWAVNRALSSEAFLKAQSATPGGAPVVGLIGFTEAAQVLTLGALLAMVVFALRIVAEARHAKARS
jgi:hypothetical protein